MGVVVEIATGVRQLGISQQSAQRAAFGSLAKHPVDLGGGGVAGSLQGDVQRQTFTVGTRMALAWMRPASSGNRRSMPRAEPVDTGITDWNAERVRRRSSWW